MDDFNKTIDHIKEKVGEENSALISDELISLMTEHKSLTEQNNEKAEQIATLKSEKDDLVNANAKLFRRLGFEDEQKTTFTGGLVNLGRSRTQGPAMPPLVFWEIHDFPKHVQNINNVLPYNH